MGKKELWPKISQWPFFLSEFNCTIEHRKGSITLLVDALSCYPICMIVRDPFIFKIIQALATDGHILATKTIVKIQPYDDYILKMIF